MSCFSELRVLHVANNTIRSVAPLRGLRSLMDLRADGNAIDSLQGLEGCTRLMRFDASWNALSALTPLAQCQHLQARAIHKRHVVQARPCPVS